MTRINVFVSHASQDDSYIDELRDKLRPYNVEMANYSIDSSKPNDASNEEYVKSLLRPRIDQAAVTVVLLSPNTIDRPWVNWEIELAEQYGKRIIGVWLPGEAQEGHEPPVPLQDFAHAVVGWQGERIADAILGNINNHEKSDGSPTATVQIRRHDCS